MQARGLSYRFKILYGVGDIANAIKVATFGLYSLFFATAVLKIPGTLVGIVGLIAMLWDAFIDPYIGYLTDKASAPSRRYSFMGIGVLTMGIGYWAFFSPPHHLSTVMLVMWLLLASFVVRTATSMFSIPYFAVGANLSDDYHERTSVAGIRGMLNAMGTATAGSLSFLLFFPEKSPGVDPKLEQSGYSAMGLTFGLAMTVVTLTSLLAILGFRKRIHKDPESAPDVPAAFWRNMRDCLRNRSFRVMLLSLSLVVVGLTVNSSLLLHYLTYYVKVNGSVALSSSQVAIYSGGLFGTFFWLKMSKKFDKHLLFACSAAITSVLLLIALPLFGEGHPLGTGDVRPLWIGYALVGFFTCTLWFIPQSMLADVVDESELSTGRRSEGAFFGMFSFGQQIATGFAFMLAGGLLDRFVGLAVGKSQQSPQAMYRIGVLYSVVPAVLFMTAAMLILRYELTRSRVSFVQIQLQQRRTPYGIEKISLVQ